MIRDTCERIGDILREVRLTVGGMVYDWTVPRPLQGGGLGRTLIRRFSGDAGQHTDAVRGFTGYGLIHYALVRNTRPRRVLCIGSRKGFVPGILALAVRDNGIGHVDFVDPGYEPASNPGKSWGGVGFWKEGVAERHFSAIGVSAHITHYLMTAAAFRNAYPRRTYGYVYIDGDHSYAGVFADYRAFWPALIRGGFMVFHDISAAGTLEGGMFGVRRFWKRVMGRHAIELPVPRESGLGIMQKQSRFRAG